MRTQFVLGVVAVMLMLEGCGGAPPPPPPPPPPTVAELKLVATSDVNPTTSGAGAPLVVRVYQLGSTAAFEKAEFFQLFQNDAATLGADLIKKEEYRLAPGETKTETLKPPDSVHAIGVFGAYRAFQDVPWRVSAPVPPQKTTEIAVTAGADGLHLAPAR